MTPPTLQQLEDRRTELLDFANMLIDKTYSQTALSQATSYVALIGELAQDYRYTFVLQAMALRAIECITDCLVAMVEKHSDRSLRVARAIDSLVTLTSGVCLRMEIDDAVRVQYAELFFDSADPLPAGKVDPETVAVPVMRALLEHHLSELHTEAVAEMTSPTTEKES